MEQKMFGCKEVAKRYGVKAQTVRNWIKNGYIPAVKIGKQFFVSPEDLFRFEQEKRIAEFQ